MPANVEIKARLEDFDVFHTLFKKVFQPKDDACKTLEHCDTFFKCNNGRLKLREIKCQDNESAELIFYDRTDAAGPKKSDYIIYESKKDAAALKDALLRAHGKRGVVKKTRLLYTVEQTRVHIDKVDGIGQFVEVEVVLREAQKPEDGQKIAEEFMEKLNITPDMLVKVSYIDLLADAPTAGTKENGVAPKEKEKSDEPNPEEDKEMEEVAEVTKGTEKSAEATDKSEAAPKEAVKPTETKEAEGEVEKAKPEEAEESKDAEKAKADEVKEVKEAANGDVAKDKEENGDKDNKDDANEAEKMDTDEGATEKTIETKAAETPAGEVAVDAANTEA